MSDAGAFTFTRNVTVTGKLNCKRYNNNCIYYKHYNFRQPIRVKL